MTDNTCRDVLARYEERVEDELETSAACDELRHVSTMLPKMRAMLDEVEAYQRKFDDPRSMEEYRRSDYESLSADARARNTRREKFMRWLGFVQGVFWCRSVYTIEEMKQHNRPSEATHG